MTRSRNHGLRKVCACRRARWPKCPHSWYFNFTWQGEIYRFGIDKAVSRHLDSKTEAETRADEFRAQIRAGTFGQSLGAANITPSEPPATPSPVGLDTFIPIFIERSARASGKVSWKNDAYMLAQLAAHQTAEGRRLGTAALSAITEDELEAFFSRLQAAGRAASTSMAADRGFLVRLPAHRSRPWSTIPPPLATRGPFWSIGQIEQNVREWIRTIPRT